MSFDRSSAASEAPDTERPTEIPAVPHDSTDSGELADVRQPSREERIAAYWQARNAADKEYAAWGDQGERQAPAAVPPDGLTERDDADRRRETAASSETSDTGQSGSIETAALRQRVAELESRNADRDKQLAAAEMKSAEQDQLIADLRSAKAEQDKRLASLETDLGRITASVLELREQRSETQPSAELARRAGGGQTDRAERAEPEHERRLPTDAVNNVIAAVAGGAITDLAYHVQDLPPEYAGIGASGLAIGAGIIAVWRERRKAKDDADHRPDS
jgi:uncharacterized coiled-coil protein SlyX